MAVHQEQSSLDLINQDIFRQLSLDSSVSTSTIYTIVEAVWKIENEFTLLGSRFEECKTLSRFDEKTGLLKYSDSHLTSVIKNASRYVSAADRKGNHSMQIGYVRFDLDDFSHINNRFGHETGDHVLKRFADFLLENSRPTDVLIRFGGEEFDVMLPATDEAGVISYLSKIFKELQGFGVKSGNSLIPVTASAGAAVIECPLFRKNHADFNADQHLYRQLQNQADDALYASKFSGKNTFTFYEIGRDEFYTHCRKIYAAG